jgi:methylglutaconyl-CoA hydratase
VGIFGCARYRYLQIRATAPSNTSPQPARRPQRLNDEVVTERQWAEGLAEDPGVWSGAAGGRCSRRRRRGPDGADGRASKPRTKRTPATTAMLRAINTLPVVVIGRIHGAALGGGSGLAAVCDIVIAEEGAIFGFTETKLGILPAMISPFVLPKIGVSHARALFLTGTRFTAAKALAIGLVHTVVAAGQLDAAVADVVREALTAAPPASAPSCSFRRSRDGA